MDRHPEYPIARARSHLGPRTPRLHHLPDAGACSRPALPSLNALSPAPSIRWPRQPGQDGYRPRTEDYVDDTAGLKAAGTAGPEVTLDRPRSCSKLGAPAGRIWHQCTGARVSVKSCSVVTTAVRRVACPYDRMVGRHQRCRWDCQRLFLAVVWRFKSCAISADCWGDDPGSRALCYARCWAHGAALPHKLGPDLAPIPHSIPVTDRCNVGVHVGLSDASAMMRKSLKTSWGYLTYAASSATRVFETNF